MRLKKEYGNTVLDIIGKYNDQFIETLRHPFMNFLRQIEILDNSEYAIGRANQIFNTIFYELDGLVSERILADVDAILVKNALGTSPKQP